MCGELRRLGRFRRSLFTQDDGHVFCRHDQVAAEIERFCRGAAAFYAALGSPDVQVALSTRPAEGAGDDAMWDRAEALLAEAAAASGMRPSLQPGEGAFYGPKLELSLRDRLGRAWQCGTIQLDDVLPGRFGLEYVDADGQRRTPAMLHRALYGSVERFLAILLEQHEGALPAWLAPVQVLVTPIGPMNRALRRCPRDVLASPSRGDRGYRTADLSAMSTFVTIWRECFYDAGRARPGRRARPSDPAGAVRARLEAAHRAVTES